MLTVSPCGASRRRGKGRLSLVVLNKKEAVNIGTKRDAYVEKPQGNIAQWNGELDELQAKADKAKTEIQAEFLKQIAEIKAKRQALEGKMTDLKNAADEAWDDVKNGVDVARQILGQAVKSAKDRFNQ